MCLSVWDENLPNLDFASEEVGIDFAFIFLSSVHTFITILEKYHDIRAAISDIMIFMILSYFYDII